MTRVRFLAMEEFFYSVKLPIFSGTLTPLSRGTIGSFHEGEASRPDAGHSPQFSVKFKNKWSYDFVTTYVFMVLCLI
jgi:hypothetical protein